MIAIDLLWLRQRHACLEGQRWFIGADKQYSITPGQPVPTMIVMGWLKSDIRAAAFNGEQTAVVNLTSYVDWLMIHVLCECSRQEKIVHELERKLKAMEGRP